MMEIGKLYIINTGNYLKTLLKIYIAVTLVLSQQLEVNGQVGAGGQMGECASGPPHSGHL